MSIALDLGSDLLRSLRVQGDRLLARRCRATCSILPDNPAQRRLLEQSRIPFATCEDSLVLIGSAAVELAQVFGVPRQEILPGGIVPPQDPVARQLIAVLTEALLGPAQERYEVCSLVQPAHILHAQDERQDSLQFFQRLLRLQGYIPCPISAGRALAYATLGQDAMTGIVLALGRSGTEVAVVYRGQSVVERSLPRGTRWLDQQLAEQFHLLQHDPAGQAWLDIDQATRFRERSEQALVAPSTDDEKTLRKLASDWISNLVSELEPILVKAASELRLKQPLPLICGGGLAQWPGLVERLTERLRKQEIAPLIGEVRRTPAAAYTICRGALIHAELEAASLHQARAVQQASAA